MESQETKYLGTDAWANFRAYLTHEQSIGNTSVRVNGQDYTIFNILNGMSVTKFDELATEYQKWLVYKEYEFSKHTA